MSVNSKIYILIGCLFLVSCKTNWVYKNQKESHSIAHVPEGSNTPILPFGNLNDTTFVNIKAYSLDLVYDMKYATEDNFLKAKVYDCAECYLRLKTVKAIMKANAKFMKKGFRIKLYDCYRPLDIQKKMWAIVSNPIYVADPNKGSIHNRGGAVDISLVDKNGVELDMGTPFDFFGIEASHDNKNFSKAILDNRKLLKKIMLRCDFQSFDSEWWHYNRKNAKSDGVSNFKWKCE
jgi:D-alanyl-D-alanine dipeptidase